MIVQLFILMTILILLYIYSRKFTAKFTQITQLISVNRKISFYTISFILLPGTIVHELSHFLMATILRVPTGEISILPEIENEKEIRAGKVMLGKTDPIRMALIGIAPVFSGLLFINIIGNLFLEDLYAQIINLQFNVFIGIGLYLLFTVCVTMFSSKKDLQSLVFAGPITIIFLLIFYFSGIRLTFTEDFINTIGKLLYSTNGYLLIGLILNLIFYLTILILEKISQSITVVFKR